MPDLDVPMINRRNHPSHIDDPTPCHRQYGAARCTEFLGHHTAEAISRRVHRTDDAQIRWADPRDFMDKVARDAEQDEIELVTNDYAQRAVLLYDQAHEISIEAIAGTKAEWQDWAAAQARAHIQSVLDAAEGATEVVEHITEPTPTGWQCSCGEGAASFAEANPLHTPDEPNDLGRIADALEKIGRSLEIIAKGVEHYWHVNR